jgi:putative flippase GtrA
MNAKEICIVPSRAPTGRLIMPGKTDPSQDALPAARTAHLYQFIRFAAVGVLQNGVNLGIFALAIAAGVPYLAGSVLAAAVALSVSFFLNLRWTFRGSYDRIKGRALRFITIWVTIVLAGLPILALLVSVAHLPRILAQAIIITIGAPISYAAQRRWTFSS